MALTDKLSAIGQAIREKTGGTELLTLDAMPGEIRGIETGGGSIEVEPVVLTDDCAFACGGPIASNYIKLFGDTITTKDIAGASNMFNQSTLESIPFDINLKETTNTVSLNAMFQFARNLKHIPDFRYRSSNYTEMTYMFSHCNSIETLPYIYNAYPANLTSLFANCYCLKEIPEDYFDTWNFERMKTYQYAGSSSMFSGCNSLRKMPLKKLLQEVADFACNSPYSCFYYNLFTNFSSAFGGTSRLKKLTFNMNEDGTPIEAQWKAQVIDLSTYSYVGWQQYSSYFTSYNSDITADKEVYNDATYQALKNDPDWFATKKEYSRYNHDSAVETINSLPDTSAYLATAGGTNTIKFTGECGSLTDGGAINTLTEEEIAVAAAKGWTVTFA